MFVDSINLLIISLKGRCMMYTYEIASIENWREL